MLFWYNLSQLYPRNHVKKTNVLLFLIILVYFTGCEDKKSTETFTSNDTKIQIVQEDIPNTNARTFIVKNKQKTEKITLLNEILTFHTIQAPIVMINLFKPTCTTCISQIKSFDTLEKEYQKKLSIVTLFKKNDHKNNIYFAHALYRSLGLDIDTSLPLSIIYKKGKYYSHFIGSTPIEMITYDIQQAIQN